LPNYIVKGYYLLCVADVFIVLGLLLINVIADITNIYDPSAREIALNTPHNHDNSSNDEWACRPVAGIAMKDQSEFIKAVNGYVEPPKLLVPSAVTIIEVTSSVPVPHIEVPTPVPSPVPTPPSNVTIASSLHDIYSLDITTLDNMMSKNESILSMCQFIMERTGADKGQSMHMFMGYLKIETNFSYDAKQSLLGHLVQAEQDIVRNQTTVITSTEITSTDITSTDITSRRAVPSGVLTPTPDPSPVSEPIPPAGVVVGVEFTCTPSGSNITVTSVHPTVETAYTIPVTSVRPTIETIIPVSNLVPPIEVPSQVSTPDVLPNFYPTSIGTDKVVEMIDYVDNMISSRRRIGDMLYYVEDTTKAGKLQSMEILIDVLKREGNPDLNEDKNKIINLLEKLKNDPRVISGAQIVHVPPSSSMSTRDSMISHLDQMVNKERDIEDMILYIKEKSQCNSVKDALLIFKTYLNTETASSSETKHNILNYLETESEADLVHYLQRVVSRKNLSKN
jgi:hypothetical protein